MGQALRLSRARMIDRMLARDAAYDGRFVTGVLSTGIYCIPSCKAKNPKPENVRFFPTLEAAREAGLRPCKRCRPDDFYRRRDPDLQLVEDLVARMRTEPAAFDGVRALERAGGVGSSKLHELFRRHYHATPARLLGRARVGAARRLLLESDRSIAAVAYEVGFDSLSSFNERFRRRCRLSPGDYRKLAGARSFEIALPASLAREHVLSYLGRDAESLTQRVRGNAFETAWWLGETPALARVELGNGRARCALEPGEGTRLAEDAAAHAHGLLLRCLGLGSSPAAFEQLAAGQEDLAPLVARRRGLRIPQTPDLFHCLVWTILGQQIHLGFAFLLHRRLVELAGRPVKEGLWAVPRPAEVAALEVEPLLERQYSRRKAEYLVGVARLLAEGKLDAEALATASATRVESTLLAVRGLGPWSVHYLLMRGLGFEDCVPVGDSGLVRGLAKLFRLEKRPDARETLELMERFAPYRSFATYYLWQNLDEDSQEEAP